MILYVLPDIEHGASAASLTGKANICLAACRLQLGSFATEEPCVQSVFLFGFRKCLTDLVPWTVKKMFFQCSRSEESVCFWASQIHNYLHGSGSFRKQAKDFFKKLYFNSCDFVMTCYLWRRCKCTFSKKKTRKPIFVGFLKSYDVKSRIRICYPVYESKDPDPYQNVTYPEHWVFPAFRLGISFAWTSCCRAWKLLLLLIIWDKDRTLFNIYL